MGHAVRRLKALIAEDEPILRGELRETLAKLWPELEICAEAEDGVAALREIAAHEPDILFLDEPTSGIDPLARRAFWRTITALAQGGVTVIVTTHFMEEAEYCDRIAIQDAGRVLALGTPQQVRQLAGGAVDMNGAFIAIVEQGRAQAARRAEVAA